MMSDVLFEAVEKIQNYQQTACREDNAMPNTLQDYATLPLPLTTNERQRLQRYEALIDHGLGIFYEVAEALSHIHRQGLYRETHRTFEEYCRERFKIDRSYAYRLMDSNEIRKNVLPIGDIQNEAQARALKGLEPDQQRQVLQKAIDTAPGGKVTAQHIKDVRQQETPIPEPEPEPVAAPVKQVRVFVPDEQPRPTKLNVRSDDPDEREPEAVRHHEILTTCHFCGNIFKESQVFINTYNKESMRSTICRACASKALHDLPHADDPAVLAEAQEVERYNFRNTDRAKIVKAGLRLFRVDMYACVIKEFNGIGWELFEKHDSKAAVKRSVDRWATYPTMIFEDHP